jgi:hypothetical protein
MRENQSKRAESVSKANQACHRRHLPSQIWLWWSLEGAITYILYGVAMGWAVGK